MELNTVPSFSLDGLPTVVSGESMGLGGTRIAVDRIKFPPNGMKEVIKIDSQIDGWHIEMMLDKNKTIYALKFSRTDDLPNGDKCITGFLVNYSENNADLDNTKINVFVSNEIKSKWGNNPTVVQIFKTDSLTREVDIMGTMLNEEFGVFRNEEGFVVYNSGRVWEYKLNEVFHFSNGALSLHRNGFQLVDSGGIIYVGIDFEYSTNKLVSCLVNLLKRNTYSLILSDDETAYLNSCANPDFLESLVDCFNITPFRC